MQEDISLYTNFDTIKQAADFCQSKLAFNPEIGLILGSGLGAFADQIEEKVIIAYKDIPFFKQTTVMTHKGNFVFGKWKGKNLVAMQGRYHYYEGHSQQFIVFPIRVMKLLGIKSLLVTNASGSINQMLAPGDFMIIRDHVNFQGNNSLIGPNDSRLGPRFPDMTHSYDPQLRNKIKEILKRNNMSIKEGVYACFTGPSFESASEIKMAAISGCDVAGMSTVPEVIAANQMGIKVAGISCVCNMATGISKNPLTQEEVFEAAEQVKNQFIKLVSELIPEM